MEKIAIDISGLGVKYKSGAHNVVYSYISGYLNQPSKYSNLDIIFYDRSGLYNSELASILRNKYVPINSFSNNKPLSYFFRAVSQLLSKKINLNGRINHVWHWNIYTNRNSKSSITIADLLPIQFPMFYKKKEIEIKKKALDFAKNHAHFVSFISHSTRDIFLNKIGYPKGKMSVIHPGIDPLFFDKKNPEVVNFVLSKYGLTDKKYFLSYGYIDPRKNIINQLHAFDEFMKQSSAEYYYVIAGIKNRFSDEILKTISNLEFKKNVYFIGYVTNIELISLLDRTSGVLFCSLGEGFGLPIIESYASKKLIITSNNTSMKEIGGDGRSILVNPYDIESITGGLMRLVSYSEQQKEKLLRTNLEYSSKFTVNNWFSEYINFFTE